MPQATGFDIVVSASPLGLDDEDPLPMGFEAVAWIGLLAPANTPTEVVAKLNAEVKKILETPDFRGRLAVQGFNASLHHE